MAKKHDQLYDKTKIQIMMKKEAVFYATILFSLKQSWEEDIPTAGVSPLRLLINPDWFISLSEKERIGLVLHEVLHVVLQHSLRVGTRNHKIFNKAGDYVINLILHDLGYEIPGGYGPPDGGLYNPDFKGMSTEQVYTAIYKDEMEKQKAQGSGGESEPIPGTGDDLETVSAKDKAAVTEKLNQTIQRAVVQAKRTQAGYGSIPGEVLIELEKFTNPKLPCAHILDNYMQNLSKGDYSWRRPNKYYAPDFYMPSLFNEQLMDICVAVDSSGSVSDEEFNYFISVINRIKTEYNPQKITVIDFDYQIRAVHTVTENTNVFKDISFSGRGGTAIEPVLAWADKNKPKLLLVFTDGDFYHPKKPNTLYPVVWLIHDDPKFEIDFGTVIHYDMDLHLR